MQTRKDSLIESIANIVIGYLVAIVSQIVIFPLFDIYIVLFDHLLIGLWFTLISLVRSYVLRRWFNQRVVSRFHKKMRDHHAQR